MKKYRHMMDPVHYCTQCREGLVKETYELQQYYEYVCCMHACIDEPIILTERLLDESELEALAILEGKGYIVTSEVDNGHGLAVLPTVKKFNNVNFYCSRRNC